MTPGDMLLFGSKECNLPRYEIDRIIKSIWRDQKKWKRDLADDEIRQRFHDCAAERAK